MAHTIRYDPRTNEEEDVRSQLHGLHHRWFERSFEDDWFRLEEEEE